MFEACMTAEQQSGMNVMKWLLWDCDDQMTPLTSGWTLSGVDLRASEIKAIAKSSAGECCNVGCQQNGQDNWFWTTNILCSLTYTCGRNEKEAFKGLLGGNMKGVDNTFAFSVKVGLSEVRLKRISGVPSIKCPLDSYTVFYLTSNSFHANELLRYHYRKA